MTSTVVIAILTAAAGREEEFAAQLTLMVEASHKESGVVSYTAHQVPGSATYVLVEAYASARAFDDHLASQHVSSFMRQFNELLDGEPQILQTVPLPIGDPAKRLTDRPST
jgi:quinol monooxygenase YgiN